MSGGPQDRRQALAGARSEPMRGVYLSVKSPLLGSRSLRSPAQASQGGNLMKCPSLVWETSVRTSSDAPAVSALAPASFV